MHRTRIVSLVALAATALGLLAGCTGSSSGSRAAGRATSGEDARAASAPGAVAQAAPPSAAAVGNASLAPVDRYTSRLAPALILTASISVTVARPVGTAADRAETIASAAGGRTDSDDRSAPNGSRPTASLTLRVPNDRVPGTLRQLAALGHQTARRLSTQDVTTQVADVASRVTSARQAIGSLNRLYAQATKVGDVIRIESTLSQREADLESLEARLRALDAHTALATITLDLTQRRAPVPPPPAAESGGFTGGLRNGWHAFTSAAGGLAVAIGAVLPFALLVLVVAVLGLVVRRRWRDARVPRTDAET